MLVYDGVLVDPGGTRMRASLIRHLKQLGPGRVDSIVATHGHEEHVGNLELASELTEAPVFAGERCLPAISNPPRIPIMRALVIGQPEAYAGARALGERLETRSGELRVFPAPGHCDDQIVLYDPRERLLISGDAFVGTYFSSPNADADSGLWLASMRRLQELPIEVMLTGHGQIYTLRGDIPEIPGVVIRRDPGDILREKAAFLEWLREQVAAGLEEGLPQRAIEATMFPWNRPWSWENLFSDELARVLSGGEFSRSELVRSFLRNPADLEPLVYQAKLSRRRSPLDSP